MVAKRKGAPRNVVMPGGVMRFSRSVMSVKKASYKKKKYDTKPAAAAAKVSTKTVEVGGAKNGKTRVVALQNTSRYYPAVDVKKPLRNHKHAKTATLRASITPGTIVILLAGPHRGRRVIALKQLASGLLLVTGPFKFNGVPLKRVNQAYVIATSQKLDISKVNVDAKLNDDYFKRPEEKKSKTFLKKAEKEEKKTTIAAARKTDQKAIDAQLLPLVKAVPQLNSYLSSYFSLGSGLFPHELKF